MRARLRSAVRKVQSLWRDTLAIASRNVAAALSAAAALVGAIEWGPLGSLLGFPVGVIAREIGYRRTNDLRRFSIDRAAGAAAQMINAPIVSGTVGGGAPTTISELAKRAADGDLDCRSWTAPDCFWLGGGLRGQRDTFNTGTGSLAADLSVDARRLTSRVIDRLTFAETAVYVIGEMAKARAEAIAANVEGADALGTPDDACRALGEALQDVRSAAVGLLELLARQSVVRPRV